MQSCVNANSCRPYAQSDLFKVRLSLSCAPKTELLGRNALLRLKQGQMVGFLEISTSIDLFPVIVKKWVFYNSS
jgi:hypothetical protein